ncbi:cell wall-binding repeat-containing protein, partial [Clostridioides difficile]|uniref:cell wall-binding repeat-containing protein n=1 Tax=Clostridioides difficile TaxID=1496 RepID=UPI003F8D3682
SNISEVVVVNGEKGLADAVSVGAVAAQNKMPIILSSPKDGIKQSSQFIKDKGIKQSYVIGGVQSISEATKNTLPSSKRLSGNDRNETNAAVINGLYSAKELKNAYITKDGMNKQGDLIDSLAVGSLAAKNNSPVVLVGSKLNKEQEKVLNT